MKNRTCIPGSFQNTARAPMLLILAAVFIISGMVHAQYYTPMNGIWLQSRTMSKTVDFIPARDMIDCPPTFNLGYYYSVSGGSIVNPDVKGIYSTLRIEKWKVLNVPTAKGDDWHWQQLLQASTVNLGSGLQNASTSIQRNDNGAYCGYKFTVTPGSFAITHPWMLFYLSPSGSKATGEGHNSAQLAIPRIFMNDALLNPGNIPSGLASVDFLERAAFFTDFFRVTYQANIPDVYSTTMVTEWWCEELGIPRTSMEHFMDPATHEGWGVFGSQTPLMGLNLSAGAKCSEYFDQAVIDWNQGNPNSSVTHFTWALHFVQDLCIPTHGDPAWGSANGDFTAAIGRARDHNSAENILCDELKSTTDAMMNQSRCMGGIYGIADPHGGAVTAFSWVDRNSHRYAGYRRLSDGYTNSLGEGPAFWKTTCTAGNELLVAYNYFMADGNAGAYLVKVANTGGTGNNMFAMELHHDGTITASTGYNYLIGYQRFNTPITKVYYLGGYTFVCFTDGKMLKINGTGGTGASMFAVEETAGGFSGMQGYSYYSGHQCFSGAVTGMLYADGKLIIAFNNNKMLKINGTGGTGTNMFAVTETPDGGFSNINGYPYYSGHSCFMGSVTDMLYADGMLIMGFSNNRMLKINGTGGTGGNMFAINETAGGFTGCPGYYYYSGHSCFLGAVTDMLYAGGKLFIGFNNGKLLKINGTGGTGTNMFGIYELPPRYGNPGSFGNLGYAYYSGFQTFLGSVTDMLYAEDKLFITFNNGRMLKINGTGGTGANMFAITETPDGGFSGLANYYYYGGHSCFLGQASDMAYMGGKLIIAFNSCKMLKINGTGGTGGNMFAIDETEQGFSSVPGYSYFGGCQSLPGDLFTEEDEIPYVAREVAPSFWGTAAGFANYYFNQLGLGTASAKTNTVDLATDRTDNGLWSNASVISLAQNSPNPCTKGTSIRYVTKNDSRVQVRIYNISGQLVRTLVNGYVPGGHHTVMWDGRCDNGQGVSAGVYVYRLSTGTETLSRLLTVIR